MIDEQDPRDGAGPAFAVLVTIGVAAVLVTVRGHVDNSVVVLILAAVVSACGLLGGWRAGVAGALAAAVSFNFFHTRPYLSLRIHDFDDILTTATLLVVGLMGGAAAHVVGRRRTVAVEASSEVAAIERVLRQITEGADVEDLEVAVRAELLNVLHLVDCQYVSGRDTHLAVLGRGGSMPDEHVVTIGHDGGYVLPGDGVALPVVARGSVRGHLVCVPAPGTSVSLLRRRTAVALAGLLGTAMAAAPNHP